MKLFEFGVTWASNELQDTFVNFQIPNCWEFLIFFTPAEKMKLRAELDDLQAYRRRNIDKRDRLVAKARLITARATRCRAKVLTIIKLRKS